LQLRHIWKTNSLLHTDIICIGKYRKDVSTLTEEAASGGDAFLMADVQRRGVKKYGLPTEKYQHRHIHTKKHRDGGA
jgi:hypothetical protein